MQVQQHTSNDDDLLRTKRQLTRWRATHLTGSRIPERLWRSAASLATIHGLSYTARTLGLDYTRLKERATPS